MNILRKRHNKIKARIKNGHATEKDLIDYKKLKKVLGYETTNL